MQPLNREPLEQHLREASYLLLHTIGPGTYDAYILGFVFLKRLSDRFHEEAEELILKGYDKEEAWEDRDLHPFFVPKHARWPFLEMLTSNIGEGLNTACAELEEWNSSLEGALLSLDFNSEKVLGGLRQRDEVLRELISHFSVLSLRNASLGTPERLSHACEHLLSGLEDDSAHGASNFYAPKAVTRLLVQLLDPQEGMRICDPTCGVGGMLIECARHMERKTGRDIGNGALNITLHGQEVNPGTWTVCKQNLLLHGLLDARIERGDVIRQPKLTGKDGLLLYDRVISNPPFNLGDWGVEEARLDPYNRFKYGLPPKNMGNYAFVQHIVATLAPKGMAALVMPLGVLFREAGEGRIRRALVEADLFEAVIGLPGNLFYATSIPAAVLVLNREKPAERKGKVLFIHAAEGYSPGRSKNVLRAEDIQRIVAAFHHYRDEERFAKVVSLHEIQAAGFNLSINRYIETGMPEAPVEVPVVLRELREAEAERDAAVARMDAILRKLGYEH